MDVCPLQVSVRIRPANFDYENIVALNEGDDTALAIGDKAFVFDKIFKSTASQEEIYNETVKPFVQKVLAGYSCTCLAYGQTGTGKTYTMFGQNKTADSSPNAGVISRALEDIFAAIHDNVDNQKIEVSFIEIYNQKIFDLLKPSKDNRSEWIFKNLKIEPSVFQEVRLVYEALELLKFGDRHRHTGETKMNAKSSRSHTIFTIKCTLQHDSTTQVSKLNLVDLGGSESIKRTGNEGMARIEGIHINQSLLALRQVLIALSRNDRVVPFRESLLTTVLYDSLTTKNYIILIACISSQANDYFETLSTLRFAESTKDIKSKPEIEVVLNRMKTQNPSLVERCHALLHSAGINATPAKTAKLNNTIATPGHRRHKPLPSASKVNHTYSPVGTATIMRNNQMLFTDIIRKSPPADFDLDSDANLSSSTVLDAAAPPEVSYSPIVRKCTEAIEDKLAHIVSDQLNTIMRRRSKRLALMEHMSPPTVASSQYRTPLAGGGTPLRINALMHNIEDTIKQMVETQMHEMAAKFLNKKDSMHVRKLFTDISNTPSTASTRTSEDGGSTASEDHLFKIPATATKRRKSGDGRTRRSKRIVYVEEEKENIYEGGGGDVGNVQLRRRSKRISMMAEQKEVKSEKREKRVPKTPHRYSPSAAPATNPKQRVKKEKVNPALVKHQQSVLDVLNSGSARDLTTLSLVGPKTSEQILTYRSLHGPFRTLKDLKRVKCWSDKQLNKFLENNYLV